MKRKDRVVLQKLRTVLTLWLTLINATSELLGQTLGAVDGDSPPFSSPHASACSLSAAAAGGNAANIEFCMKTNSFPQCQELKKKELARLQLNSLESLTNSDFLGGQ